MKIFHKTSYYFVSLYLFAVVFIFKYVQRIKTLNELNYQEAERNEHLIKMTESLRHQVIADAKERSVMCFLNQKLENEITSLKDMNANLLAQNSQ